MQLNVCFVFKYKHFEYPASFILSLFHCCLQLVLIETVNLFGCTNSSFHGCYFQIRIAITTTITLVIVDDAWDKLGACDSLTFVIHSTEHMSSVYSVIEHLHSIYSSIQIVFFSLSFSRL